MDLSTIEGILEGVKRLRRDFHENMLKRGEEFNLFRIVRLTTQEVRVHSAFLAELLNPLGSHGQGCLFLRLFTELLDVPDFRCEQATVVLEKGVGRVDLEEGKGGQLDILVTDSGHNCIVIENKIYARDQEKQLLRYYNYCRERGYRSFRLFYLTLDGRLASDMSKEDKEQHISLQEGKDYFPVSYATDMVAWLERCREAVRDFPVLREGLSQYLYLIKDLTHQSQSQEMKEDIVKLLYADADALKAGALIEKYVKSARAHVQWNFWKGLRDKLQCKLQAVGDPASCIRDDVEFLVTFQKLYTYYHSGKNMWPSIWLELEKGADYSLYWAAEVESSFFSGFVAKKNGEKGTSGLPEFNRFREIAMEVDKRFTSSDWWLGWKYSEPRLNFWTFNSEEVYQLADPVYLEEVTERIAEESVRDIRKFRELLSK